MEISDAAIFPLQSTNLLEIIIYIGHFIRGKGEDDCLTRAATFPTADDPKLKKTEKLGNNIVIPYLINAMINGTGENFLLYGIRKEILEAVNETVPQ